MTIPETPKPKTLVFSDKAIAEIQDGLKDGVSWLNHCFGKSQKLVEKKDKKTRYYPGVHLDTGEYVNVFPDDSLGNFSFCILGDPHEIVSGSRSFLKSKTPFSIVFWLNLDTVFEDKEDRNLEAVKLELLTFLTQRLFLKSGRLSISKIYEDAKNIYKEYSVDEVDSQFLMQPYSGLRFEGELQYDNFCR